PISFRRRTNAAVQVLQADCEVVPKKPIIGNFRDCCARAASGHAAEPPSSVMKSRRFMSSMGDFLPYALSARRLTRPADFRHLSLPAAGRLVLGADLNCSESRR